MRQRRISTERMANVTGYGDVRTIDDARDSRRCAVWSFGEGMCLKAPKIHVNTLKE